MWSHSNKFIVGLATCSSDDLPGDDKHEVVVGITSAHAADGLEVTCGCDDLFSGDIGVRPEEKIAGTEAESGAMG